MAAPNRTPLVDPDTGMVTGAWLNYFVDTLEGGGGLASFSNVTINRTFNGGVAGGLLDITIDASRLTGTTLATAVVNSSLTGVGTLTSGKTGRGFTIDLASSSVNGAIPWSALPSGAGTWTAQPTIIGLLTVNGGIRVLDNIEPQVNFRSTLGKVDSKFLALYCAELNVETLVAQDVMATIGGRVIVAPTTSLTADLTAAATTITVKHNSLSNGDRILLMSTVGGAAQVEWMAITSAASGVAGAYVYSVTRNLDGTGANAWFLGDAVVNTGTTGNGFIDLYSTTGVFPGTTLGPTIVGNVRTGTTYSQVAPRWAIGNLKGLYGYTVDSYGAAFGDPTGANLTLDATNGYRVRTGTTTYAQLTGTMFTIGSTGANRLTFDGTGLTVVSANLTIDPTGIVLTAGTFLPVVDAFAYRWLPTAGDTGEFGTYGYMPGSGADKRVEMRAANNLVGGSAGIQIAVRGNGGATTHSLAIDASTTNVGTLQWIGGGAASFSGTMAWGGGTAIASSSGVPQLALNNIFTGYQQTIKEGVGLYPRVSFQRTAGGAGSAFGGLDWVDSSGTGVVGLHVNVVVGNQWEFNFWNGAAWINKMTLSTAGTLTLVGGLTVQGLGGGGGAVSVGALNSGGAGFRLVLVPN